MESTNDILIVENSKENIDDSNLETMTVNVSDLVTEINADDAENMIIENKDTNEDVEGTIDLYEESIDDNDDISDVNDINNKNFFTSKVSNTEIVIMILIALIAGIVIGKVWSNKTINKNDNDNDNKDNKNE